MIRTRSTRGLLAVCCACAIAAAAAAQPAQPSALGTDLRQRFERKLDLIASNVDGVVGFSVLDLTSGVRYGHLDAEPFPTASTIKLAIVYELMKQADEGRVSLDRTIRFDRASAVGGSGILFEMGTPTMSVRDYATLMVVLSDNSATNVLIDLVGMDNVTRRMETLGLKATKLRRHMIDLAAARRGDENVSTPSEITRLLETLYRGDGLSAKSQDEALALLKKRKATPLVRGVPAGIDIASKPGDLEGVRVDAGIVFARNRPYVLTVMTTYLKSEGEGERAIEEMSRAAYNYFSRIGAGLEYGRQIKEP